jgi:hypothetical protein
MKIELTRGELINALQHWVGVAFNDKSLVVSKVVMTAGDQTAEVTLERKANVGATGKSSPAFPDHSQSE